MTQKDKILQYLKRRKYITPFEAFTELRITKLATRISEMRKDGMEFRIEMVTKRNKYNTRTVRYAKYSLPF